jgi:hypothetical protein
MEVELMMLKPGVELLWRFKFAEAESVLSAFADNNTAFSFHFAEVSTPVPSSAHLTPEQDSPHISISNSFFRLLF